MCVFFPLRRRSKCNQKEEKTQVNTLILVMLLYAHNYVVESSPKEFDFIIEKKREFFPLCLLYFEKEKYQHATAPLTLSIIEDSVIGF